MRDGGKIALGLVVFVVVVTAPLWLGALRGTAIDPPQLTVGTDAPHCVEDTATMRADHMELLDQWRDAVVRDGERWYVAADGTRYEMSLRRTCLGCHTKPAEFCDRCHERMAVAPYCWDCHVESVQAKEKT